MDWVVGKMLDASGGTKQTLGAVTLTRGLLWVQVPTALQQGQTQSKHTMDLPNAAAYIYTVQYEEKVYSAQSLNNTLWSSVLCAHFIGFARI